MADIIGKQPDISPIDVHPTRTAGGSNPGDGFVRCKQCGFILDPEKHSRGSGYGNETTASITTIAGSTANAQDPTVGPGCPFCGASEY